MFRLYSFEESGNCHEKTEGRRISEGVGERCTRELYMHMVVMIGAGEVF